VVLVVLDQQEGDNMSATYLTIKDVATLLHIGYNSAYKLFKIQGFPFVRIGRKYLVEDSELQKFLDEYKNSTVLL
jgi:excisionase family DNA binding protein